MHFTVQLEILSRTETEDKRFRQGMAQTSTATVLSRP